MSAQLKKSKKNKKSNRYSIQHFYSQLNTYLFFATFLSVYSTPEPSTLKDSDSDSAYGFH